VYEQKEAPAPSPVGLPYIFNTERRLPEAELRTFSLTNKPKMAPSMALEGLTAMKMSVFVFCVPLACELVCK
jgi:hypothetical protein